MKVIDRSGREYKFVVWGRDEIIDLINKLSVDRFLEQYRSILRTKDESKTMKGE